VGGQGLRTRWIHYYVKKRQDIERKGVTTIFIRVQLFSSEINYFHQSSIILSKFNYFIKVQKLQTLTRQFTGNSTNYSLAAESPDLPGEAEPVHVHNGSKSKSG